MIRASCHTADNALALEFDATPWFVEADRQSLLHLARQGWSSTGLPMRLSRILAMRGSISWSIMPPRGCGRNRSKIPPGMRSIAASTNLMRCTGWPRTGRSSRP